MIILIQTWLVINHMKTTYVVTLYYVWCSLGPRPKTNPSADHFQYHFPARYTGSNIRAG